MAILQKLVSHGGKRLSLYADKGCHLRKMAALLFPEESSTILRLRTYYCIKLSLSDVSPVSTAETRL